MPQTQASRVLLGAWWLAALVISTSYTGSLTAFLTVPTQAPRIATLPDLAEASQQLYMLDFGAFLPGLLKTSVDSVYRTLGNKLHLLDTYEAIRQKVEEGHALVQGTHYTLAVLVSWHMSNAYVVEETMYPNHNGWAFPKDTPWTHLFNGHLTRMTEAGLVNQWHRTAVALFRHDNDLPPLLVGEEPLTLRALSLEDTQSSFIILGIGISLALLFFCFEILSRRSLKHN
ncbi:ionotropic receptor 93a-like [Homarus americanus]|uniref:Glutamate receptor 4-like 2 n=1 Tax=Homarus americanus TaxID=6706 RepID=A0A8J5N3P7_HOMAM|nr:ionotropic receptor 93a-like [Homarus americanus]KAG7172686.1 Glutamate receptor 4-like 2 [Homarus americanus]